mmetsp:Transcript_16786/g.47633  ORF Transcript_16786/g.47633 Transcript_16786/m.47633 type:complete len:222 (-) Transcript_16786:465-1130(-)
MLDVPLDGGDGLPDRPVGARDIHQVVGVRDRGALATAEGLRDLSEGQVLEFHAAGIRGIGVDPGLRAELRRAQGQRGRVCVDVPVGQLVEIRFASAPRFLDGALCQYPGLAAIVADQRVARRGVTPEMRRGVVSLAMRVQGADETVVTRDEDAALVLADAQLDTPARPDADPLPILAGQALAHNGLRVRVVVHVPARPEQPLAHFLKGTTLPSPAAPSSPR